MFGYVLINPRALSKEERQRYNKHYCGLCHQLSERYGSIGRSTLTYDMTFLSILVSSLYELDEREGGQHCISHPIRKQSYVETDITAYAADMNIILTYYNLLDDVNDDNNPVAKQRSEILEKYLPKINEQYPKQCSIIKDRLQQLGKMEAANELNPDLPANCFGELMGSVFVWREDEYAEGLWRMGAALGRFIYLLDAVNDLRADIKKQRYNPLIAMNETEFTPMLTVMMAECTAEFEKLPIKRDRHILQNVLYSGVWQRYRIRKKKGVDA